MSKDFYRAFEEKHRGSRDSIKSRLEIYLPFLEPLRDLVLSNQALDLGCGRGEWLELLGEHGYDALGIDIDDAMLEACRERGFHVKTYDAISYLQTLPDECLAIVSAFHLVEHIRFEDLQALLAEAKRVLRPGGLLILETPNPENLTVGTCHFYLDPTHLRPVPPELLLFSTEYAGFVRSKILRLQETKSLILDQSPTLMSVLAGASPDYAVVAQKDGAAKTIDGLQAAFDLEFGLSLDTLAARFQNHLATLHAQTQLVHAEAQAAFARIEKVEAQIQLVLNSDLWRIAAPLHWLTHQLRLVKQNGLIHRLKALSKKILRKLKSSLQRNSHQLSSPLDRDAAELTPQARQICADLKTAISDRKKG